MTIQNKERKSNDQHAEFKSKKNENATPNLISHNDETELLKRKSDAEKARKRTRGPYRKSNAN